MASLNSIINNQTNQTCYRFSVPMDSSFSMDDKIAYACAKNSLEDFVSDPSLNQFQIDASMLDLSETNNVYQAEFDGETAAISTKIYYLPPAETQFTDVIGTLGNSSSNVSVTSGFDESSVPIYNTVIAATVTDGLVDGRIETDNYTAVFNTSDANYNMQKSINSAETTGTDSISMVEDASFNTVDSLYSSKSFSINSTTGQITGVQYRDPSNNLTTMYNYDSNGYTASVSTDPSLVPAFGIWKLTQAAPTIDVSYSVAPSSFPFMFEDASGNVSNLASSMTLSTFNGLFAETVNEISDGYQFQIQNITPGSGYSTVSETPMIGNINTTQNTLNPSYMQLATQDPSSGFADEQSHSFQVNNGSLTFDFSLDNSGNVVNNSFVSFDDTDAEYLGSSARLTDGSLNLYFSNRVTGDSTYDYDRAFSSGETNALMPKLRVTYDYIEEEGSSGIGSISTDVRQNENVSYETTVLLPSTANTAGTFSTDDESSTYHANNIACVSNTAFIVEASINTSNSPTSITCTSSYVPESGSFAIFDITTHTNYTEDTTIYDPSGNVAISNAQASLQGAELTTSSDAQQFRASIVPRVLDASFSSMESGGWIVDYTSGTSSFQFQKGTTDVFGSNTHGIAALPSSTPLVLNMNLTYTESAKNVDFLSSEVVYSYNITAGEVDASDTFNITELTQNIVTAAQYQTVIITHTDPSFVYTYSGAAFPSNLTLKNIVKTTVKTVTADFPFGTITNLTVTSPAFTETDTYYELWNGSKKLADYYLNKVKLNNVSLDAQRTQVIVDSSSGTLNYDWGFVSTDLWTHKGEIQAYNGTSWVSHSNSDYVDLSYDNPTTLTTTNSGSAGNIDMVFDLPFNVLITNAQLIVGMNIEPTEISSTTGIVKGYQYNLSSDLSSFLGWDLYMDDIIGNESVIDLEPTVVYTVTPAATIGDPTQLLIEVKLNNVVKFSMSGQVNISQNIRILCIPGTVMQVVKSVSTGEYQPASEMSYIMPTTSTTPSNTYWVKLDSGVELQCYPDTYSENSSLWQLNADYISCVSYFGDTSAYTTIKQLNTTDAQYSLDNKVRVQPTNARSLIFEGFRGIVPITVTSNPNYQFVKLDRIASSVTFNIYFGDDEYRQTYSDVYTGQNLSVNALTEVDAPNSNIGDIGLTFTIQRSMAGSNDNLYSYVSIDFAQYTVSVVNEVSQVIEFSETVSSIGTLYSNSAFSIVPRSITGDGELYTISYIVPDVSLSRNGTTGLGTAPLLGYSSVATYTDSDMRTGMHVGDGSVIMMRTTPRVTAHVTYFQSVRPQFKFTQLSGVALTTSTYPFVAADLDSNKTIVRYGSLGALVNGVDDILAAINPYSTTTGLNNIAFSLTSNTRTYTSFRTVTGSLLPERFVIPSNNIVLKMYNGYIDLDPSNGITYGLIVSNDTGLVLPTGQYIAKLYDGPISGLSAFSGHSYVSGEMEAGVTAFYDEQVTPMLHPISSDASGNGFVLNISRPIYMYSSTPDEIFTPRALMFIIGDKFLKTSFNVQLSIMYSSTISIYGTIPRYDSDISQLYMDVHRYTTGYGVSFTNLAELDPRTLLFNAISHSVCSVPVPSATFGSVKINYYNQIAAIDETTELTWVDDEDFVSRFIDISINALTTAGSTNLTTLFDITREYPQTVFLCKLKDILCVNGNDGIPLMRITNNGKIKSVVGLSTSSVTLTDNSPEQQYQEGNFYPNVTDEVDLGI